MKDLSKIDAKDILSYKNALVVIAIIIFYLFHLRGAYLGYSDDLSRIERESETLEGVKSEIMLWEGLVREYDELVEGFFEDDVSFRRYVEEQARKAGARILSLRPSREGRDFYEIGSINLELNSYYNDLVEFVVALEERHVFVERITLNRDGDGVGANLRLETVLISK